MSQSCWKNGASIPRTRSKVVVPPPGVPVGSLIARGEVELGFQQMSEFLDVQGIEVAGCCRRRSNR